MPVAGLRSSLGWEDPLGGRGLAAAAKGLVLYREQVGRGWQLLESGPGLQPPLLAGTATPPAALARRGVAVHLHLKAEQLRSSNGSVLDQTKTAKSKHFAMPTSPTPFNRAFGGWEYPVRDGALGLEEFSSEKGN